MSLSVYTPSANTIVHTTFADMSNRQLNRPVHLVQYDRTLPVLKIDLYNNNTPYVIPSDFNANIRWRKGDGNIAYNPVLGKNSASTAVYVEVTEQMAAAHGDVTAVVELLNGSGNVVNSSIIPIQIDRNPVQDGDINSTSEAKSIIQYVQEAKQYADSAKGSEQSAQQNANASATSANIAVNSADAAKVSEDNALTSETNAKTSETNAATSEANAATSETNAAASEANAKTSETNAATSEANAATSETNAGDSATLAESWAVGGTGTRTGEDTDNSKYYCKRMETNLLSPKNDYDPDVTYNKMDWVLYDNKLWLCTVDGTIGVAPSDTTPEWQYLIKNGDQGPMGKAIDHIEEDKVQSVGKKHVFIAYYTDGTTFTYTLYDGSDGTGGDMYMSTYDKDQNGVVDFAENIKYQDATGTFHQGNSEVLVELNESPTGELIYKGSSISGGAIVINKEDYDKLDPDDRVGKQYAIYDDDDTVLSLATETASGVVQLVTDDDVTNPVGTALPATEKNPNIAGTLANLIDTKSAIPISKEDYDKLTPQQRSGKVYAVMDDMGIPDVEAATLDSYGLAKISKDTDVIDNVGLVLSAAEKNPNVEGSLASSIDLASQNGLNAVNEIAEQKEKGFLESRNLIDIRNAPIGNNSWHLLVGCDLKANHTYYVRIYGNFAYDLKLSYKTINQSISNGSGCFITPDEDLNHITVGTSNVSMVGKEDLIRNSQFLICESGASIPNYVPYARPNTELTEIVDNNSDYLFNGVVYTEKSKSASVGSWFDYEFTSPIDGTFYWMIKSSATSGAFTQVVKINGTTVTDKSEQHSNFNTWGACYEREVRKGEVINLHSYTNTSTTFSNIEIYVGKNKPNVYKEIVKSNAKLTESEILETILNVELSIDGQCDLGSTDWSTAQKRIVSATYADNYIILPFAYGNRWFLKVLKSDMTLAPAKTQLNGLRVYYKV